MSELAENLENVVRRTRVYIQVLKEENASLLEWQSRAIEAMQNAARVLDDDFRGIELLDLIKEVRGKE